ncbi:MAG: AAA family ATPase [Minicystis sp.]
MRLTKVTLWNFRSFWSDNDRVPAVDLSLTPGVNYFAGPNNAGKSNLLRAVALALDPQATCNHAIDRPQAKMSGPVGVELEFAAGPDPSSAVKQLLEDIDAYEQTVEGFQDSSLASEGIVRLLVEYFEGGHREERFLTRATYEHGRGLGLDHLRQGAVAHFHKVVRFVDIKSGEDLQSLLQRGFKEILGSAVSAEHAQEMKAARKARDAYIEALQQVLLPVARHVEERIRRYVRGIEEVDLVPDVPPIEDAIADARVFLKDAVRTALEQKGTGVRGAMLLLMLSFIADSSRSAVVFGIEEPEAFLHPETHRELGAGLERFTQRPGVTMLVTTHSPFIFRSDGGDGRSAVFVVRKGADGRSSVAQDVAEAARTDLLGSRVLSSLIQKADEVPETAKLVLVVEGWTDRRYLEIAAQRLGIAFDTVHLVAAGGAVAAAVQTVTLRGMHLPERLVVALFDGDDDGRVGQKLLVDKFKLKNRVDVLSYEHWIAPDNVSVEAEDLFGKDVIEMFLREPGNDGFLDEKKRRPTTGGWHYGLTKDGKSAFVSWLEKQTDVMLFEKWREPLICVLKLIADAEARAAKKAAHEAAQATKIP